MKKDTKILFRTINKSTCVSIVLLFILIQHKLICQTIVTTPRYSRIETQSFKDSIVLKGDMDSWFWLSCTDNTEYSSRYELEIPYVLVLANRYNNPYACEEVFILIKELYDSYNLEWDSQTIEFVLFYLNKGADLGRKSCLYKLYDFYLNGKYVCKDIEKANHYKKKIEELDGGACPNPRLDSLLGKTRGEEDCEEQFVSFCKVDSTNIPISYSSHIPFDNECFQSPTDSIVIGDTIKCDEIGMSPNSFKVFKRHNKIIAYSVYGNKWIRNKKNHRFEIVIDSVKVNENFEYVRIGHNKYLEIIQKSKAHDFRINIVRLKKMKNSAWLKENNEKWFQVDYELKRVIVKDDVYQE